MKIRFINRRERRIAAGIFDNVCTSLSSEADWYDRLNKKEEADDCRLRADRAEMFSNRIKNDGDFTVHECSECLDILIHLPPNMMINDMGNAVEDIKDRFADAYGENSRTITDRS